MPHSIDNTFSSSFKTNELITKTFFTLFFKQPIMRKFFVRPKTLFSYFVILFIVLTVVIFSKNDATLSTQVCNNNQVETFYQQPNQCECRKLTTIEFLKTNRNEGVYSVFLKDKSISRLSHWVTLKQLNRTTCDLYNTLRRPMGQKVYAVSLYGKNKRYYNLLECKRFCDNKKSLFYFSI